MKTELKIDQEFKEKIIPLTVGVLIFLGVVLFLKPFIIKTLKLNEELKGQNIKLSKLKEKKKQLNNLDEEQLKEEVQKIEQVLPSKKPIITLLDCLFNLAQKEDVALGRINFRPGALKEGAVQKNTTSGKAESMHSTFIISGELDKIISFLDRLQNQAPLMRVDGFGLNVEEEETTINLNLKVFYYSLPESLGKVSDPLPLLSSQEEQALAKVKEFEILTIPEGSFDTAVKGKQNPFRLQ